MDREAIARAQRRRLAEEALEVERDRMALLEGQIEDLVTELIGARVDDEAFATMSPEDVETVRALLNPDDEWPAAEEETAEDDPEPEPEPEDLTAELETEISRLQSEIAISRQRQQALERYRDALGSG